MAGPEIAAVVAAFDRDDFVLRAARSVAAQTVPRASYELAVVTNFHRPEIERELLALGAKVLYSEEPQIGAFMHLAANATTAPWLAFLDDDDEFEPERFARFLEVRRAYPGLGFYRNRVRVIDRDGRAIPPERWRRHELDAAFDDLGDVYLPPDGKERALEIGLQRTWASFNSSTMIVRRELLDGDLGRAFDRQRLPDTLLYLAAVLRPVGLYLDPRRLTRFRFWEASATGSLAWFRHATRCNLELAEVAERHGATAYARLFRELSVHYGRMARATALADGIAARAARREIAARTGDYLRYLGRHPDERRLTIDTWAAGAYGLGYALAPGAVHRLAGARLTRGRHR